MVMGKKCNKNKSSMKTRVLSVVHGKPHILLRNRIPAQTTIPSEKGKIE